MPARKKWERKFEAIRDKILARTGAPLKKAEQKAAVPNWTLPRAKEYATPRHQKPWEAQYEAVRDEVLSRWRGRVERVKEEIQRTGTIDLTKSAEDRDPFLLRVERFLGQVSLRKEAVRDARLAKYSGRARDRVALIKNLARLNAQTPAPNLAQDLRKERLRLIEDMLCVFAIRRGLA